MGIQKVLSEHRIAAGVAGAVAILLAFGLVLRSGCSGGGGGGSSSGEGKGFFTDDDGQHFFIDDAAKVPPFPHDGKPAYRAMVYRCKTDNSQFVAWLERYADADRQRLVEIFAAKGGKGTMPMELAALLQNVEMKKPGDAKWVRLTPTTTDACNKIKQPTCPGGAGHAVEPVLPH